MNLWIIVIILLVSAILLLLISFFTKEEEHALLTEVSDFTLQITEDVHALKTRLSTVEKIVKEDSSENENLPIKKMTAVTKQHAVSLHEKGKTIDEIAEQLNLPETTVQLILDNHQESLQ